MAREIVTHQRIHIARKLGVTPFVVVSGAVTKNKIKKKIRSISGQANEVA